VGAAGVWRNAFIGMPYPMQRLILRNVISDTFETAISALDNSTMRPPWPDAPPRYRR
jgi:hypothetical protein